ncbi:MAG: glycosyl hydrolase family 28 protein [Prevotella sp.]|nr:glycosyl hydrolase family 28 protein [Prevotella sp.]
MKKSILQTIVLAALLALPTFAKAQTFAGITEEQSAQNTPEGWTAVALPQLPAITAANTFNITSYGASTSSADNTKAIQAALDAVPATGGMVVIPAGTWLCGALQIKSKTIFHLAKNCTLLQQPYGTFPNNKTNFIREKKNATDIVIEGEDKETSIIDGQGEAWWRALDNGTSLNRGALIRFNSGSRFLVRNLTCKNAPAQNITLGNKSAASNSSYALNATVHDVFIYAPASELSKTGSVYPSHNTDGIPIWDPYVNIYNCEINNGDDNVVCDSYSQYIHVWNCKFGTGHGASVGSFTKNIKHVWFDNITMNGTTAGVRLKTGIESNGSLRGGGEEDFRFTNFTMTKVKNPFSMDCYYDKKYNADPAVDKANARALDSTTPTYNGILLQNIKTTDVCTGNAIFLVGRPESHIKNVTLDNVQINAEKGIDIRFVDNLVFKNGSKITVSNNGTMWVKNYDSTYDDQCDATKTSSTPTPTQGDDTADSYILYSKTLTDGSTPTATFSNGFSISNEKGKTYAVGSGTNYIKYSANQYSITIPKGIKISKIEFEGKDNYDTDDAYIGEINGETYDANKFVFPKDKSVKSYSINFSTPVENTLTFTPKVKQVILKITLYTSGTTGITAITADSTKSANLYDLSGRLIAKNATADNLKGLSKGIYILNNKKYTVK